MVSSVHPTSVASFAKGTNELYNEARPQYPPEVLGLLRRALKMEPQNIVEIASGTGLFTRALLGHPEWASVQHLKAIEPSEGMREVFSKYTTDDRVTQSEGTFDATRVESGWADCIVIAHAFHWCQDYEATAAEFARVLKPGGVLALVWNNEDKDAVPWLNQFRDRIERDEHWAPQWRNTVWRQFFSAPSYTRSFSQPEEQAYQYIISGSFQSLVKRGLSSSPIAISSDDEKDTFVKDVEAILEEGEGMVWIDEKHFQYPHRTELVVCARQ